MSYYDFLITTYGNFVGVFPASIRWVVTLLIIVGLVGILMSLVRHYLIFVIVLIILVPFLIPVVVSFVHDLGVFFGNLAHVLKLTTPPSH